jgi:hypothetical protein
VSRQLLRFAQQSVKENTRHVSAVALRDFEIENSVIIYYCSECKRMKNELNKHNEKC